MRVPTIFQGKPCKCGSTIVDRSVKEMGIDFNTEQFVLRYTCLDCGFNGRLVFKTENNKIEDLCAQIANMRESSEQSEDVSGEVFEKTTTKVKTKKTSEDVFCAHFDQNSIGCLFIPEWTEEGMREFEQSFL